MKRYGRWLALLCTLAIMGLIFYFSSQPGAVSYRLSGAVTDTLQAGGMDAVTPQWFSTKNLNANVRKWAHVYIYCALGVSVAVTVHLWIKSVGLGQQALMAAAVCMLYAAGDELHQYFVPARAMLLSDVAIDAAGFLPCIGAAYLFLWIRQRRRR